MKNVAVIISDSDRRGDTIRSRSRYVIYFERARDDAKTGNNDIDVVTILKSLLVEDIIRNKHVTSRFDLITIVFGYWFWFWFWFSGLLQGSQESLTGCLRFLVPVEVRIISWDQHRDRHHKQLHLL